MKKETSLLQKVLILWLFLAVAPTVHSTPSASLMESCSGTLENRGPAQVSFAMELFGTGSGQLRLSSGVENVLCSLVIKEVEDLREARASIFRVAYELGSCAPGLSIELQRRVAPSGLVVFRLSSKPTFRWHNMGVIEDDKILNVQGCSLLSTGADSLAQWSKTQQETALAQGEVR